MKTIHDYESLVYLSEPGRFTPASIEPPELLSEVLQGSQVVSWYSMIEDFLQRKLDDQEAARNRENADRLRAFLNTWRENELTGSISVDQLRPLKAAAEQASAVKSSLRPIFTSVLRNLRKLIADEEQLPRGIDTGAVDPLKAGLGRAAPPMSPDFGPDKETPDELAGLGADEMEPPPEEGKEGGEIETAAGLEPTGSKARR
jgi:hypothetical protein